MKTIANSTHQTELNISNILDLMDLWRHYPSYQLERRVDIWVGFFLKAFLEQKTRQCVRTIIPEFPLRLGTLFPEKEGTRAANYSCKVDFLVTYRNLSKVTLLELKTEQGSRNEVQDKVLLAARAAGLSAVIRGVLLLNIATAAEGKYGCLLDALVKGGILKSKQGLLRCARDDYDIEILYIQPKATGRPEEVGFEEFAVFLDGLGDTGSSRFAKSLRCWALNCAGSQQMHSLFR